MSVYTHPYDSLDRFVVDVETTVKNKGPDAVGTMQASPFHPSNRIVLFGEYLHRIGFKEVLPGVSINFLNWVSTPATSTVNQKILIGHNIKFDLLHIIKQHPEVLRYLYTNNIYLWDTMIVEYLLSGQQTKFSSLDELSTKYGGTLKNNKIKKYWEDGVETEDIPIGELTEYLEEDISNTYNVFYKQYMIACSMKEPSILNVIETEMESLKDTIHTEWNGIHVDSQELANGASELHKMLTDVEEKLKTFNPDINWSSPKQLSAFLYGGNIKVGDKEEVVLDYTGTPVKYKTGKKAGTTKTKIVPNIKSYLGFLQPDLASPIPPLAQGGDTSEEVLKSLYNIIATLGAGYSITRYKDQLELLNLILNYRKYTKDFNTYYIGIAKNVWGTDDCVHAQFNHTVTDTGRLSSSKPNLQNISGE